MMDEDKLYDDLKSHISGVFDNYEDTTADEGWELLRQRYPEKEDRKLVAWWFWYGAAAVLLLGLGLWFIPKTQQDGNGNIAGAKHPIKVQPPVSTSDTAHLDGTTYGQNVTPVSPAVPSSPENILAGKKQPSSIQVPGVNLSRGLAPMPNQKENMVSVPLSGNQNSSAPIASVQPKTNAILPDSTTKPATSTGVMANNTNTANKADAGKATAGTDKPAVVGAKMTDLLNQNPLADKKPAAQTEKKAAISVYAATFFNYAKGSDNQLNVGAGLTSDFKLSKRLKLTTGLAIAQNSLSYNNDGPNTQGGGGRLYGAAADIVSSSATSAASFSSAVPLTKNYSANLVGLDVPINLKFQLDPDKSDTFISAGLSSGTFINETYTTNYNYANTTKQTVQKSTFSGFDFARTLNLSFGMGYPMGKSNRLIIEPFLKYPLGGLGEQNIRFGAGGINLKLNFQPAKK